MASVETVAVEARPLARELRAVCDEYEPERVLLGEVFGPAEVLQAYTGGPGGDAHSMTPRRPLWLPMYQ